MALSNVAAENNEDVNIFLETKSGGSIIGATLDNFTVTGSNDEPTAVFCDGCGIWLHTLGTETIANIFIANSVITGNYILNNGTDTGIVISNDAAEGNHAHNNNSAGNGVGVDNQDPDDIFDATDNWWWDPSGPYHPATNPDGLGDEVSNNVIYSPLADGGGRGGLAGAEGFQRRRHIGYPLDS